MKLDELRNQIDEINWRILELLEKRLAVAGKIASVKKELGLPIEDKKREDRMINCLIRKGEKLKLSQSFISQLFNLIISESKRIQEKL